MLLLAVPLLSVTSYSPAAEVKPDTGSVRPGKEAASPNDIRSVDFNNFTFQLSNAARVTLRAGRRVKVSNGKFETRDGSLGVTRQLYGDLTGDGKDEAVVIVTWALEGANWWGTDIYVFTLKDRLTQLALISEDATEHDYHRWYPVSPTTSEGNVWRTLDDEIVIEDRMLVVQRYVGGPHCCPEYISTLKYRWNGEGFVLEGKPHKKKFES
jgi:hypothetical protein